MNQKRIIRIFTFAVLLSAFALNTDRSISASLPRLEDINILPGWYNNDSAASVISRRFDYWTGEVAGQCVECTVIPLNENKSVTEVFTLNNDPIITEGEEIDVVMTDVFSLTLHATDVDGDTLTWSISAQPYHGTASTSGTGLSKEINYSPAQGFMGYEEFEVMVSDGSAVDTIVVHVVVFDENHEPHIVEGYSTNVIMSENGTPIPFDLTLNADDMDGDSLTWSIATQASHGTAIAFGTGNSMSIGYVPRFNYVGTDSFWVIVQDDCGAADTILVIVTINPSYSIFLSEIMCY